MILLEENLRKDCIGAERDVAGADLLKDDAEVVFS